MADAPPSAPDRGAGSAPRHVILFGLSANPPTGLGGHAGLVRWAATRRSVPEWGGAPVDEVWVLPVYEHAYRDKRLAPFEHRLAMARLAFEGFTDLPARVRVLDVERRVREAMLEADPEARPGTIDVVTALQAEHPGVRFALLLGADTYRDLREGKWKSSEELLARVTVVAVPRRGHRGAGDRTDGPDLEEVSSSAVRSDYPRWRHVLQPPVRAYIEAHGLYGASREASRG